MSYKFQYFLKKPLEKLNTGDSIIEIGCGNCQWLYLSKAFRPDINLHGLDCVEQVIDQACDNGIKGKVGDARQLPFEDGEFPLVMSWGVVEHVNETELAIREHYRISSNVVVLDVPNHNSLPGWRKRRTIRRTKMSAFDAQMEFGKMYNKREFMQLVKLASGEGWMHEFMCNYYVFPAKMRFFERFVPNILRMFLGQNIGVVSRRVR
jgi:ubiquinone/menaquinone biosynthesis C-methylase UbiE